MATVSVRYIVNDVAAAIAFYSQDLGFAEVMHPAPSFAMLSRGDLRLVLSAPGGGPGGGQAMPDGTLPKPGGWNRSKPMDGRTSSAVRFVRTFRSSAQSLRVASSNSLGWRTHRHPEREAWTCCRPKRRLPPSPDRQRPTGPGPRRSRPRRRLRKQRDRRLIFYSARRTDVAATGMTISGVWPLLSTA